MEANLNIQPANWFKNPSVTVAISDIQNIEDIDRAIQTLINLKYDEIITKTFKTAKPCK